MHSYFDAHVQISIWQAVRTTNFPCSDNFSSRIFQATYALQSHLDLLCFCANNSSKYLLRCFNKK